MCLTFRTGIRQILIPVFISGFLSACSSSGSGSGSADTTLVSGTVVAAPVAGASLTVTDSNGNTIAGPVATAKDGSYRIDIPNGSVGGALIFESGGGTYTDEVTGASSNAGSMTAVVDTSSMAKNSVHLTPATTIVQHLVMQYGMTLTQARDHFKTAFGFAADTGIKPEDVNAPAADASNEEKLAGLRAAAFSQLTADLGLNAEEQFELLAALAEDLADGRLDGNSSTGRVSINSGHVMPTDIQNRFTRAMIAFHQSARNKTGLGNDQIGVPVFSREAQSSSYTVEYVPGTMAAMEGKTKFSLRISDGNGPVSGLSPKLMPMMHMGSGMQHSSPSTGCAESVTTGVYDCTVYYLMPSTMGGMSMGYWELTVMLPMMESVTFYPPVMMAMGDTAKVKLKGQADMVKDMMGMDEKRNYYIFRDALTGSGPYTLTLFIASKENMMSFPAVIKGNTLRSGKGGNPLDINSVEVTVSANGGAAVAATDNGDGTWNVGLAMNNGVSNQVEVRLLVNGERKTSDGTANGLDAKFTVTPGGV